jgi:adenine-specific DNA-methyltransferase
MVVQAPEVCNQSSDAFRVGYQTIADIAKERIKRAISNFNKEENILCLSDDLSDKDLGLKVYKLDRSNLKIWNDYEGKDVQVLQQSLFESQDPLLEGWTVDKVVTELQLLEGFSLDSTIEPATNFSKNQVLSVASEHIGHRLFICLDPKLDIATIQQVRLLDDEDIFICLDASLTDQEKMMLADGCNIKTI